MNKSFSLAARVWKEQHMCLNIGANNNRFLPKTCLGLLPTFYIPSRTTVILRRKHPVPLYKEGNKPQISDKNRIYELIENSDTKIEPLMEIVLTTNVKGVGNKGDIISRKKTNAYHNFLLPGLADYPTPENLEYARLLKEDKDYQERLISPSEEACMSYLEKRCISIVMNKETEWTIEPWHIRANFRKGGVQIMSESSIELPKQPIKGPDMNLEGKHFYVTLTVNKKHKVKVWCRIHHWSTDINDRLPYFSEFWNLPFETVFPETTTDSTASSTT